MQVQDWTRKWGDLIVQSLVLQASISIVKIYFCLDFKSIEDKTNKLTNTIVTSWELNISVDPRVWLEFNNDDYQTNQIDI